MRIHSHLLHEFLRLKSARVAKRNGAFKAYMRLRYTKFA